MGETDSLFEAEIRKTESRRRQAIDWLKSLEKNVRAFREGVKSGGVLEETVKPMAKSFISSIEAYKMKVPEDLKIRFDEIRLGIEKEFDLEKHES